MIFKVALEAIGALSVFYLAYPHILFLAIIFFTKTGHLGLYFLKIIRWKRLSLPKLI